MLRFRILKFITIVAGVFLGCFIASTFWGIVGYGLSPMESAKTAIGEIRNDKPNEAVIARYDNLNNHWNEYMQSLQETCNSQSNEEFNNRAKRTKQLGEVLKKDMEKSFPEKRYLVGDDRNLMEKYEDIIKDVISGEDKVYKKVSDKDLRNPSVQKYLKNFYKATTEVSDVLHDYHHAIHEAYKN